MPFTFAPFRFLSDADAAYLADNDHREDKLIYVDCLALMHDVLADFSSNEDHSVFPASWIQQQAVRSIDKFQPQAHSLKTNVRTNLLSAMNLYGELTSPARTVTRFVALSYVDAYINDLLDQYRNLRYSRLP